MFGSQSFPNSDGAEQTGRQGVKAQPHPKGLAKSSYPCGEATTGVIAGAIMQKLSHVPSNTGDTVIGVPSQACPDLQAYDNLMMKLGVVVDEAADVVQREPLPVSKLARPRPQSCSIARVVWSGPPASRVGSPFLARRSSIWQQKQKQTSSPVRDCVRQGTCPPPRAVSSHSKASKALSHAKTRPSAKDIQWGSAVKTEEPGSVEISLDSEDQRQQQRPFSHHGPRRHRGNSAHLTLSAYLVRRRARSAQPDRHLELGDNEARLGSNAHRDPWQDTNRDHQDTHDRPMTPLSKARHDLQHAFQHIQVHGVDMTLPLKDIYTSRNGDPLSSRSTSAEPARPFERGDYLEGRNKTLLNETHAATTDAQMLVPQMQFLSAGNSEVQSLRFGWGPSGQRQKKSDPEAAEYRRMQSFLPGKRVLQGVHTAKSVQLAAIRANGRRSGDSRVQGRPRIGGVNGVGVCDFLNRTYTPQKLSISQLTAAEIKQLLRTDLQQSRTLNSCEESTEESLKFSVPANAGLPHSTTGTVSAPLYLEGNFETLDESAWFQKVRGSASAKRHNSETKPRVTHHKNDKGHKSQYKGNPLLMRLGGGSFRQVDPAGGAVGSLISAAFVTQGGKPLALTEAELARQRREFAGVRDAGGAPLASFNAPTGRLEPAVCDTSTAIFESRELQIAALQTEHRKAHASPASNRAAASQESNGTSTRRCPRSQACTDRLKDDEADDVRECQSSHTGARGEQFLSELRESLSMYEVPTPQAYHFKSVSRNYTRRLQERRRLASALHTQSICSL